MIRIVCVVGLLLASPAAAAPTLAVVEAPTEPLGSGTFVVAAFIPCNDVRPAVPDEGRDVVFATLASHPGITVTGQKAWRIDPTSCGPSDHSTTVEAAFEVQADGTTPGETPHEIVFEAHVTGDSLRPDSATSRAQGQVVVAYVGLVEVSLPSKIVQVDGSGTADMVIKNMGNSRTMVSFEVVQGRATAPATIVLGTPMHGEEETEITSEIRFDGGGSWQEEVVQVRVVPASAKTGEEGEPVVVNILFRNGAPLAKLTPAPALPLALLGLAIALRRRM